jgi:hypothetical protein
MNQDYTTTLTLLHELEIAAYMKGYASANLKRYKFGSKNDKENNQEFDKHALELEKIKEQIIKRLGLLPSELEL